VVNPILITLDARPYGLIAENFMQFLLVIELWLFAIAMVEDSLENRAGDQSHLVYFLSQLLQ
jgi:Na+/phosphate symporter